MGKYKMNPMIMLLLLIFFWGASWPINKLALSFTPPIIYASFRALFGRVLLIMVIWKSRAAIRWKEHWRKYCISAFFNANTICIYGDHDHAFVFAKTIKESLEQNEVIVKPL